jgi:ribosomal protein S19E (S16A)
MVISGSAAIFLLDIANARAPSGVPVPYSNGMDAVATALERAGLIERHHVGVDRKGAVLTDNGRRLLASISPKET